MKQVEIDRLLQWTFCDQISKKQKLSVPNVWGAYERYMRLGCSINASGRRGDLGDVNSLPDIDAVVVVGEVQKLNPHMSIVWSESKDALLGDGLTAIAPDEMLLVFDEVDLVIEYAQSGISPIWNVGLPKPQPIILANGKPAVSGKRYGKDRYAEGAACPVRWGSPTIEGFILARARYAVWHSALTRLQQALRGKLKSTVVLSPKLDAAPWAIGA
jgi:hypothetical protein